MDIVLIGIAVNVALIGALLFLIFVVLLPVVRGAPYVPTDKETIGHMVALANIHPGERAIDLGSGDGRLVMALARAGARAHGYEVNPLLVLVSRWRIWRAGLSGQARIHWKSLYRADFFSFDVVFVYGYTSIMGRLEPTLIAAMPPNGRVVSHLFRFPHWPCAEQKGKARLYRVSDARKAG